MPRIKVSIIIPVYNVKPYLRECVDSAINQTLRDIEIILVDDGSTDGSGAICDGYATADKRVTVIHKPNGGLSSARNAGLKVARGEYIYFLDSDDYIELTAMEALYKEATEHDLDMVLFTAKSFIDGDLQNPGIVNNYQIYRHHVNEIMSGVECLKYAAEDGEYIAQTCMRFYRAELFENGNRLTYQEGIIHEDEDIGIITLLNSGRVKKLTDPFYNRRYRPGSIMTEPNRTASARGYLYAAEQMLKCYDEAEQDEACALLIKWFEQYLDAALRQYSAAKSKQKREIAAMIRPLRKTVRRGRYPLTRKKTKLCLIIPAIGSVIDQKNKYRDLLAFKKKDSEVLHKYLLIKCSRQSKIFLLGSPIHGNLGDHLIALSQMAYLKRTFPDRTVIDCTMPFANEFLNEIKQSIRRRDMICLSGGGWLGTKWRHNEEFVRRVISTFPDNPVVILPQTVYYQNEPEYAAVGTRFYSAHKQLLFCVREQASYDYIISQGFVKPERALLMPDFALLYHNYRRKASAEREGIMLCLRDDVERVLDETRTQAIRNAAKHYCRTTDVKTNVSPETVGTAERQKKVWEKIDEIGRCRLLITDRLHAMIMAAIAGTPCLAFDNATHKVKGVYQWISELNYIELADDTISLKEQIERMLDCVPQMTLEMLNLSRYEEILKQRIDDLCDRQVN